MKTFVVGDVHGRCAQLHALLKMVPRDEEADLLVFLGDLIDRGPDAPGCVDLVMNIAARESGTCGLLARQSRTDVVGFHRRQCKSLDYAGHRRRTNLRAVHEKSFSD